MPKIGQMPPRTAITHWLLMPPVSAEDEDKTRLARTLHYGLVALMAALLVNLIAGILFGKHRLYGASIVLVSMLAVLLTIIMLRKGHVRPAAKFLATYAWLAVSLLVYLGDGLSTVAPSLYAPAAALTLLFLGWRASLISASAALAFTLALVVASELGHEPPIVFPLPGFTSWTVFAMGLVCMLVPYAVVYREVTNALQNAQTQLILREKAEAALRASEERFRLITSITSDYTFESIILDNGLPKNVAITGAFQAITGYTFAEYEAMGGYRATIYPEDMAEDDRILDILKTNQPVVSELRIYTKSGDLRWTRANATPVWDSTHNKLVGIIGAVRDITAQKLAEQALHDNEEKFRSIFHLAPYGITIQKKGGEFLDANQAFLAMTGMTREQVIGHNVIELNLFPDLEQLRWLMREVGLKGQVLNHELSFTPPNAVPRALLISSQQIVLAGNMMVLTIAVDITERKQAEQALRESEERFRLISSATTDYTFASILDDEGRVANELITGAFEEISGYTLEEFMARGGWRSTLHPDDLAQDDLDLALLKANQPVVSEVRIIRKDGAVRWVRVNTVPVWDDETNRLVGINGGVSDITERKRADQAVRDLNNGLREQTAYLTALNDVARAVTSITNLETVLQNVFKGLGAVVQFDAFFIALYEPDTDKVEFPIMFDNGQFYPQPPGTLTKRSRLYEVITTGEPLIINRTAEEMANATATSSRLGDVSRISASLLLVPLPYRGRIIGALSTQSYTLNAYNQKHVELLLGAAYIVATAIENARLYEGLQQELADRKALNDIAYAVASLTNLQTTLQNVFEQLRTVIPFDAFYVALYHPDSDELSFPILFDNGKFYDAPPRRRPTETFGNAEVLMTGETVFRNFAPEDLQDTAENPELLGDTSRITASVMVAPLHHRGTIIGSISTQSYTLNAYTRKHAESLRGAAYIVATAIENARLYEGLQRELADRKTLNDIAYAVASLSDLKTTLLTVFDQLRAVIPFDAFYVALYDADRDELSFPIMFDNGEFYQHEPRKPDLVFANVEVLTTGRMVYRNYTDEEIAGFKTRPSNMGDTSRTTAGAMVAPLPYRGKIIGTISTQSYTRDVYTQKHAESLRGAAYIVATAIENARLYEGLQRELADRKTLNDIAYAVASLSDLKTTLLTVFDQLRAVIPFDAFYVALHDADRDELSFPIMFDNGKFFDQSPRKPNMTFGNVEVLRTGTMIFKNLTDEDIAPFRHITEKMGEPGRITQSVIVAPLPHRGKIIGTISTQSYTLDAYSQKHADSLRGAAYIVATAIENARLYEGLQRELADRKTLNDIAYAVASLSDLRSTLHSVFEQLKAVIPFDAFYVALHDATRDELSFPIMFDNGEFFDQAPRKPNTTFGNVDVLATGEMVYKNLSPAEMTAYWEQAELMGDTSRMTASVIVAPLPYRGKIIGSISTQSYTLNAYSQKHADSLRGAAYIVATAIENARLYEGLQRELSHRQALNEIAFAVTGLTDLNTTLRTVFHQLGVVVPTDAFYVALYNAATNILTYPIMLDAGQFYDIKEHALDPTDRFMQVITENRPLLINRTVEQIQEASNSRFLIGDTSQVSASMMAVPLPYRGDIIGLISVQSYTLNAYSQTHLDMLVGASYIVATAIENARLYDGLQQELAHRRAAEDAMRRSEAHLRALLDATTDIAFLMSRDGRFLTVNRTMASTAGRTTDDLIGYNGFDLLGANLRNERLQRFLKVSETGQPERWEDRADSYWWDNNLYPVISTTGEVEAFALYSRDVTEQKRLEAQLQEHTARLEQMVEERTLALRGAKEQIELILHNSNDALALAKRNGDIQTRNPAFETMFGNQVTRGIEGIIETVVGDEEKAILSHALIDAVNLQQAQRLEARIIAPDGSEKDIDLALIPVTLTEQEGGHGLLVSAHDITHLKELERFKTRFVENALHDLGTPIAGLISRIYLVKQTPQLLDQHLTKMQNQTEHLKNLLDDLRFVAELDRRQFELDLEPVDLNHLAVRVFDTYEPIAMTQNQSLELLIEPNLPVLTLDSRRMERVLVNLVSNAINYAGEGKRIVLQTAYDAKNVYLTIQDNGMGITAEDMPHIFERFYRADRARKQRTGGTGLGLSIVREVVDLHNGTITAVSEWGLGSTFTVTLPYQRPPD